MKYDHKHSSIPNYAHYKTSLISAQQKNVFTVVVELLQQAKQLQGHNPEDLPIEEFRPFPLPPPAKGFV